MQVRLLGSVQAEVDGVLIPLGGPKQRALFAMLALSPGRVVSIDHLVDGIWGESPPGNPGASLQVYVHSLRKTFAHAGLPDALVTRAPGYLLAVPPDAVDSTRFEQALDTARALRAGGSPAAARDVLSDALALWQGSALADLRELPFAEAPAVRLDGLRELAIEDLHDVRLDCGEHAQLAGEIEQQLHAHPTRERLWGQLMLALYRSDRQADALAAYGRARDRLADELGIDPGEALRQLEVAILRQDPVLGAPPARASADTVFREADAAPLATRPRAQARVPRPPSALFGRDELIHELRSVLLGGARLVTVVGPGGTGKTRVAAAVAEEVAAEVDDVYFLTAHDGHTGEELLTDLVLAIGGPEPAADDVGVAAAAVNAALHGRTALVVLDNLEVVADGVAAALALLDQAPTVTVLVTSRLPLRVSTEVAMALPPLELPDAGAHADEILAAPAVQLFLDRVTRLGPAARERALADLPAVERLCRLLDGVPLALELAAARMRLLSPSEALARLEDSLDLLASGASDGPPQQRTLVATIEWSLTHLPPSARALLDQLSIFDDGFGLETVDCIQDLRAGEPQSADWPTALDDLATLVDCGLARLRESRVAMRYTLLSPVRAYCLALYDRSQAASRRTGDLLRDKHVQWLLDRTKEWSAELDGPQGEIIVGRFADAHAQVRSFTLWCLDHDRRDQAALLVESSHGLFLAVGRAREGDELVQLVRARSLPDLPPGLLVAEARLAYHLGDHARCEERCRTALGDERSDPHTRSLASCYLAAALVARGHAPQGAEIAQQALASAEALGFYLAQAVSISVLAIAAAIQGDYALESALYERRLRVVREHGDRSRLADTLNTLAEIALDAPDVEAAEDYTTEALRLAGTHHPAERRDALITAARVAVLAGEEERARTYLRDALVLALRSGGGLAVAQCARVAAGLSAAHEEWPDAARLFALAERLSPSPGGSGAPLEGDLRRCLDRVHGAMGPEAVRRAHGRLVTVGETPEEVAAEVTRLLVPSRRGRT